MPEHKPAADAGRATVGLVKRRLAQRVVETLKARDPELLRSLAEVGVVRLDWIDSPGEGPMTTSTPIEVVERLLQRSVEQRPSLLASLGLSTIQVLAAESEDAADGGGAPTRLVVAFTDLEGFTSFTAKAGDEAASRLLTEHHLMVGPVVRSRGGRLVKRLGDGLLMTFPEPEAAVLACLELVEQQPPPLRLRAGVHLGDVVVTRDDVIGHTVNVAARVAEAAKAGEVLCTHEVREVVAPVLGKVVFGRARRRSFKGVGETVLVSPVAFA